MGKRQIVGKIIKWLYISNFPQGFLMKSLVGNLSYYDSSQNLNMWIVTESIVIIPSISFSKSIQLEMIEG